MLPYPCPGLLKCFSVQHGQCCLGARPAAWERQGAPGLRFTEVEGNRVPRTHTAGAQEALLSTSTPANCLQPRPQGARLSKEEVSWAGRCGCDGGNGQRASTVSLTCPLKKRKGCPSWVGGAGKARPGAVTVHPASKGPSGTRMPRDHHLPSAHPESTRAHELRPGPHGASLLPSKGMVSSTRHPPRAGGGGPGADAQPRRMAGWSLHSSGSASSSSRWAPGLSEGSPMGVYTLSTAAGKDLLSPFPSTYHPPPPHPPPTPAQARSSGSGGVGGAVAAVFQKQPQRGSCSRRLWQNFPHFPSERGQDVDSAFPFLGLGWLSRHY